MQREPHLSPEFIDAVARRVLDLSRRKLRVGDVARIYGVHPTWVYAHADELGAFRLGTGPKAPLRFDPATVDDAFAALADAGGSSPPETPAPKPAAGRRRRAVLRQTTELPFPSAPSSTRPRLPAPARVGGRSRRRPS